MDDILQAPVTASGKSHPALSTGRRISRRAGCSRLCDPFLWSFCLCLLIAYPCAADEGALVRIGYEHSPPVLIVDRQGLARGPLIEIINLAARRKGVRLEWVYSPEGPDTALSTGKVDVWPLIAIIPERERDFQITDPFMRVRFWLVSREDSGIRDLSQVAGRRLLHLRGRVYSSLVKRFLGQAIPEVSSDFHAALRDVCSGRADMALVAQGTGDHLFLASDGCEVGKITVLGLPGAVADFGIGALRGNEVAERTAVSLQRELVRLFDEGVLAAVWIRWGLMGTETRLLSDYLSSQRQSKILLALSALLILALAAAVWQTILKERKSRLASRALAELKKAQAMLVHSEKLASLGQMTAGIAHEINNPLAYVSSNHETLSRDFRDILGLLVVYQTAASRLAEADPGLSQSLMQNVEQFEPAYLVEAIPRKLECNRDGLERIRQLVRDLRTFSRLDEAEWKSSDLESGIRAALRFLKPLLDSRSVRVETTFAPIGMIWCSPSALNQVISNVVENAIHASAPACAVRVKTSTEGNFAVIRIEDSGHGMSPEVAARVFDPFFTTKPVGSGTGLGLSIAHQIVQQHRGEILISSEENRGTAVEIRIPIVKSTS